MPRLADRSSGARSSRVRHFSAQVAGSSEKMSEKVVPISAPSIMIRPDSKLTYSLVS
jgi:hypothetical protein